MVGVLILTLSTIFLVIDGDGKGLIVIDGDGKGLIVIDGDGSREILYPPSWN